MSKTSIQISKGGDKKWLTTLILGLAFAVFAASSWGWWHYIRSNPTRTFHGMIENNLKITSVTKQVVQESSGQKMQQDAVINIIPQRLVHGNTTINQESFIGSTTIKTESISTQRADFVRYVSVDTDQKNEDGESMDFSQVLGVWGVAEHTEETGATGELYGESVLGVVPTGNLPADKRQELMKLIIESKVYGIEEDKVEKRLDGGRPVYLYDVSIAPEAYVKMLKEFAKMVGIKQLESLDPAAYKDAEPFSFRMEVDVWSRTLTAIDYNGVQQSGDKRIEKLSGYGIPRNTTLPKDAITVEELQQKLQESQQQ